MKTLQHKVAVITGAASGLGRALALALHQQGAHLALADVNTNGLAETHALLNHATSVSLHTLDVGNANHMAEFAQAVIAQHRHVDLLINNAGITFTPKPFEEITDEQIAHLLQVNLWGVIYGVRAFLPHLRQRPEAMIVNISSLAGLVGLYGYTPYVMSKAAVRGFSEVLQMELQDSAVRVLVVHPGGVKTNIIKNAPDLTPDQREQAHTLFLQAAVTPVDIAAQRIVTAIQRGQHRLIIGMDARSVHWVKQFLPQRFAQILAPAFKRMKLS
jgi:NAD(P)-dependent dehydrogenase (short-subunit alcohol dehydrogenase family)